MGDVDLDVARMKLLRVSGSDKLHIASSLDDFIVLLFKKRLKEKHPKASNREILKMLREELSHGRRDNI